MTGLDQAYKKQIGDKLRKARNMQGLSIAEVEDKLWFSDVDKFEDGTWDSDNYLGYSQYQDFAKLYHVNPEWLTNRKINLPAGLLNMLLPTLEQLNTDEDKENLLEIIRMIYQSQETLKRKPISSYPNKKGIKK